MPDSPPPGELFHFPSGLPGFEQHHDFILSRRAGLDPLVFLDSRHGQGPGFIAVPVEVFDPQYLVRLDEAAAAELLLSPGAYTAAGSRFLAFALLTFIPNEPPTANLFAPVVLNPASGTGAQVLQLDSGYPVVHPVREGASCS
ncbi:MAG: flagellar assembly protein FliW [Bryobacteraceae bacterium]|nr:flagellar assembly protein FliW [Bryobacteraceae bacterium]